MNKIRQDILNTLAYFDIFNYPLTNDDILSFLPQKYPQLVFDEMLASLLQDEFIFKLDEFYSLQNKPALAERRRGGNQRAIKQMVIAKKMAKLLSWFPYVQTVAVSGSLSKNYSDEKSDIDFFIITSANRLWIARTCMHFLKKLSYLVGKQHWFCMNYYIDEIGLEIIEKNIFTAMEIVTLLPLKGTDCFQNFIEANTWTNKYFPVQMNTVNEGGKIKKILFRKWVEKIFNSALGDHIEKRLMNLTDKRWKKKTQLGKVNEHGVKMCMMTGPHFSKPDPRFFQAKVVQQYETRIKQLAALREVVGITL